MKKLLLKSFLLIALMSLSLTGRAQDAVAVSELSYSSVEALPFTVSEALGEGDEAIVVMGTTHFADGYQFDVIENAGHAGAYASGYKIEVDATTTVELVLDAKDPFDPYLILLDENYEIIAENDDDEGNQSRSLFLRLCHADSFVIR